MFYIQDLNSKEKFTHSVSSNAIQVVQHYHTLSAFSTILPPLHAVIGQEGWGSFFAISDFPGFPWVKNEQHKKTENHISGGSNMKSYTALI